VSAPTFTDANHHSGSTPAVDIPIPGVPVSIAVSDLDGDGKPLGAQRVLRPSP
jgi:hypothetical protein